MDTVSGQVRGSFDCGGGLKGAPAVDPWEGRVWVASHGCQLVICAPPGEPF